MDALELLARYAPPTGGGAAARYLVVDVFTQAPLAGNPLAVFTDARGIGASRMQALARELNLSESVFALEATDAGADLAVRIFTPASELPFAGHPVLGTAVLAAIALERDEVTLQTGAGLVAVAVRREGERGGFARMRQPIPTREPYGDAQELLDALGLAGSALPVEAYVNGPRQVYVALEDARQVAALDPDLVALARLGELCVSCFAGEGGRFKTRVFAPALGVAEDPATGSAAGPLAVHLARHGRIAFGQEIEISQGDEIGRPSLLLARAEGSPERVEAVEVAGHAVVAGAGAFAP